MIYLLFAPKMVVTLSNSGRLKPAQQIQGDKSWKHYWKKPKQTKDKTGKDSYVYLPGEGETLTVAGESITFKASSEDTQGAWALIEFHVPPHFAGPPLHWHKIEHEAFYVLSGTVTLQIEERVVKAPAGSFALVPPGVVHTFSNKEDVPT